MFSTILLWSGFIISSLVLVLVLIILINEYFVEDDTTKALRQFKEYQETGYVSRLSVLRVGVVFLIWATTGVLLFG